jgi:hypothetical protein
MEILVLEIVLHPKGISLLRLGKFILNLVYLKEVAVHRLEFLFIDMRSD